MNFKDEVVASRFSHMLPITQALAIEMDAWSQQSYGIELTLTATTSTAEEDRKLNRVSSTHREGRAFDVRVSNLPESLIAELCSYFRKRYPRLGAVSNNQPQLIIYKPHGTGPHLHVQVRRNIQPDTHLLSIANLGVENGKES